MVHEGQGRFGPPAWHGIGGWGVPPPPSHPVPFPPPAPTHPYQAPPSGPSAGTILSLVCNVLALCTCYGTVPATVGTVLSIIALVQAADHPDTARKLTIGSWISFGVSVAFLVLTLLLYVLYGAVLFSLTTDPAYSTY